MRPLRILVIEDELLIGLEIESVLVDAGLEVIGPVATIDDALSRIAATPIDGALLDANLNGKPVHAVAAALAEKGVPFIFLTGYGRESLPAAFREAPLISKPFDSVSLIAAVRKLAGVRR